MGCKAKGVLLPAKIVLARDTASLKAWFQLFISVLLRIDEAGAAEDLFMHAKRTLSK